MIWLPTHVYLLSNENPGSMIGCFDVFFVNTFKAQNGRHSADNIYECGFEEETYYVLVRTSLKFVPGSQIGNKSPLVQVMA